MKTFRLPLPSGGGLKSRIQLGKVAGFDHDVKLSKDFRPEAQLASKETPRHYQTLRLEMIEIGAHRRSEGAVLTTVFQRTPDMVDIHPRLHPAA